MICSPSFFYFFLFFRYNDTAIWKKRKEKEWGNEARISKISPPRARHARDNSQRRGVRDYFYIFLFFRYGAATTWACPKFCKIGRNAWMWEWVCFVLRSCSSKNRPFLWIMLRLLSLSSSGATYYKGDLANAAKDSERKRAYLPKYSEWRSNWREV